MDRSCQRKETFACAKDLMSGFAKEKTWSGKSFKIPTDIPFQTDICWIPRVKTIFMSVLKVKRDRYSSTRTYPKIVLCSRVGFASDINYK